MLRKMACFGQGSETTNRPQSVSSNLELAFQQVSQLCSQVLTSLHLPLHLQPYPVVTATDPLLLADEAGVEWLQFPKHALV